MECNQISQQNKPHTKRTPTPSSAQQCLVFGASGYVGTNLVPRLMKHGYRVRASARHREVLEGRDWKGVELVQADAIKPETLVNALEGVDVAYYLVHSMAAGRHYAALDLQAADNFRAAAERAGVKRIIYLSAVQPPNANSKHLLSRKETGERLRAGAVPVTEIRAGIIVGPGSAAFEVIRDLVYHLPIMVTPRWVRSRAQPIALEDLLTYLVHLPQLQGDIDGIYDVGGPEILTYQQMMQQFAEMVGKRPKIIPIPLLTPRLSSYWLHLITAVPASVAQALIGGLKHDILARDTVIRERIPLPLMNYQEAVAATLKAEKEFTVAARWTEGAMMFRDYRPDYAYYAKQASGKAVSTASAAALWAQVTAIGGENGYYYQTWLWRLRDLLDWMIGGVGMRGGRRHPTDIRVGDIINSWRVIALEPERHLTLMAEFKVPGAGVLEFQITPASEGRHRVIVTAHFHAAGPLGFLYWYMLVWIYYRLFRGMARQIAKRAEVAEALQRAGASSLNENRPSSNW